MHGIVQKNKGVERMTHYFIAKNENVIRILESASFAVPSFYWKEYDEVYPILDNLKSVYNSYKNANEDPTPLLNAIFLSHQALMFFDSGCDKRNAERRKLLGEYLDIEPTQFIIRPKDKEQLLFNDNNGELMQYSVVHKDELEWTAEKNLNAMFRKHALEMEKERLIEVLGLGESEMAKVWNENRVYLKNLSTFDRESLKNYFKTNFSNEKFVEWKTNGFYETVGEYYLFPSKEALQARMRSVLKN